MPESDKPSSNIELLPQPGTYALWLHSTESQIIEIGKIGQLHLQAGYYVYVGSAFGPGGIRSRLGRHLRDEKKLRWHIDYLRQHTQPIEVWIAYDKHLEHQWAQALGKKKQTAIPLPGFGSSDCSCLTHLFYSTQVLQHPRGAQKLLID